MIVRYISAVLVLLFLSGTVVSAASLSVSTADGVTQDVDNVAAWVTTGNTMDGISVTANITDGSTTYTEELFWLGGTGVVSTQYDWSLTMNYYQYNTWFEGVVWNLSNTSSTFSIESIVIDGMPGDTVFDIVNQPDIVTPGSEWGREIVQDSTGNINMPNLSVAAEYSNIVGVDGNGPLGDLYSTLTLTFSDTVSSNGLQDDYLGTGNFLFSLDTDNVNEVPEPTALLLFGAGLVGFTGLRRLRSRKA